MTIRHTTSFPTTSFPEPFCHIFPLLQYHTSPKYASIRRLYRILRNTTAYAVRYGTGPGAQNGLPAGTGVFDHADRLAVFVKLFDRLRVRYLRSATPSPKRRRAVARVNVASELFPEIRYPLPVVSVQRGGQSSAVRPAQSIS